MLSSHQLFPLSDLAKSLARTTQDALSGHRLTPVDMLVVLAEYQQEMEDFAEKLAREGRDWTARQNLLLETSLHAIRYIALNF